MEPAQFLTNWLNSLTAFTWGNLVMVLVSVGLIAAGIARRKLLLLVPFGFGCLLTNLGIAYQSIVFKPLFESGIISGLLPALALLGIGTTLDFTVLLNKPRQFFLSSLPQVVMFILLFLGLVLRIPLSTAAAIGATVSGNPLAAIFSAAFLAPNFLAQLALAAYLYIMVLPYTRKVGLRLLVPTSEWNHSEETELTPTGKRTEVVFTILIATVLGILFPGTAPLVGALMLGVLLRVSGLLQLLGQPVINGAYQVVLFLIALSLGSVLLPADFITMSSLILAALLLVALILDAGAWVLAVRYAKIELPVNWQANAGTLLTSLVATGILLELGQLVR